MGERDTLLNIALQALDSGIKKRLLLVGDVGKDVNGLLGTIRLDVVSSPSSSLKKKGRGTYSKLDGDGEEINTSDLLDLLTTGNAGKVDVAGLNEPLGPLGSLEQFLRESINTHS